MKELYQALLTIQPDAVCLRTYDRSYGIEACFVLPSGEEMIKEEFIPSSPAWLWFKEVDEYLLLNPFEGGGDWS